MTRKFLVAAMLLAFSTTGVSAQVVDLSGKGRKVILHQEVELDRAERKRVKAFQKEATFYGAIAVDLPSRGQDGVGATWGYNSLETAQEHALKYCRAKNKEAGANCVLLLSVVPATQGKGTYTETLSRKNLNGFQDLLDRHKEIPDEYGAFAASNFYNWGWAIRKTKKEAQAVALKECRLGTERALKRKSKDWSRVNIDAKTNKCRLIQTFAPLK